MSLYGHEISDEINVLEAGLERWLKMDKGEFIGREALARVQAEGGPKRKVIGLEMVERGIGRDGYPVYSLDGEPIGQITSGSPAPFSEDEHCDGAGADGCCSEWSGCAGRCRGNRVRAKQVPFRSISGRRIGILTASRRGRCI